MNRVKLFAGLQVTAPKGFYPPGHRTFQDFRSDVQTAVDLAKHMAPGYAPVDFIEFYDVEIAGTFTVPEVNGQRSGRSRERQRAADGNERRSERVYVRAAHGCPPQLASRQAGPEPLRPARRGEQLEDAAGGFFTLEAHRVFPRVTDLVGLADLEDVGPVGVAVHAVRI